MCIAGTDLENPGQLWIDWDGRLMVTESPTAVQMEIQFYGIICG